MNKTEFKGRALSFEEQVRLLESQGLIIEDRKRAIHILKNISYSRFKSYLVPLMEDRDTHRFRKGATIEQAYALYGFDRRLRELVFHEMEKIEISVRTRLAYASMDDDAGYWFTNPEYFSDKSRHRGLLRTLENEIKRSDVDSIKRFRSKYTNRFPPCWLALEASSMGTLSSLFDIILPGPFKDKLCSYYGVNELVFSSWIRHLVYIRNICAHHSRLWNHTLAVTAMVPFRPRYDFPPQEPGAGEHVYMTLCVIRYLINVIKPENTFAERLICLLDNFPQIDKSQMGFPDGWREEEFWKTRKGRCREEDDDEM